MQKLPISSYQNQRDTTDSGCKRLNGSVKVSLLLSFVLPWLNTYNIKVTTLNIFKFRV